MTRVAGLDLAAGRGRTALAVLEYEGEHETPVWLGIASDPLATDAAIITAIEVQQPAVLAIDAPLSLPARVAAALGVPGAVTLEGAGGSPYTRAAERDPIWHVMGVRPLPVSFLGGLTFRALALLPQVRAVLPQTTIIEAFPTGTLAALGLRPPMIENRRAAKSTPRARAVIQAGLCTHVRGVPDPATELLDADTLDALACALWAAAFARGTYRLAGDPGEGQIILPWRFP